MIASAKRAGVMGVEAVKVWKASGGRLWSGIVVVVLLLVVECYCFDANSEDVCWYDSDLFRGWNESLL